MKLPQTTEELDQLTKKLEKTLISISQTYRKQMETNWLKWTQQTLLHLIGSQTEGERRTNDLDNSINKVSSPAPERRFISMMNACNSILNSSSLDEAALIIGALRTYFEILDNEIMDHFRNQQTSQMNPYPTELVDSDETSRYIRFSLFPSYRREYLEAVKRALSDFIMQAILRSPLLIHPKTPSPVSSLNASSASSAASSAGSASPRNSPTQPAHS